MSLLKFGQLSISKRELCLANVLQVGQSFRWIFNETSNDYTSTMKIRDQYSVVILRQSSTDDVLEFASVDNKCGLKELEERLTDYFRVEVSVEDLYTHQWLPNDSRFKDHEISGNRILAQEPWETLISFICSSNNNISRITKMCHQLCLSFGNKVGTFESVDHYSFPTSNEIVERATEEQLRELGFGYRSKYLIDTANLLVLDKKADGQKDDTEYLKELGSKLSYEELREHLMRYTGVGPKVADCVCLMGFKLDSVVPVDVHVSRIAKRDYNFQVRKSKIKDLTAKYSEYPITKKKINLELDLISEMFVEKWGEYAGWAQGILFSNEVGKASGATTTGEIKKHKLEIDIEVKEESSLSTSDKYVTNKRQRLLRMKLEASLDESG